MATTDEDEEFVCLLHNVAHVLDKNRRLLFLSERQMASSGVTKTEDGFHVKMKNTYKKDIRVTFPTLELRPPTNDDHESKQSITMLSKNGWNPPDVPLTGTRGCSVCGQLDCRRPRCLDLHSFGLGVIETSLLMPAGYAQFSTQNRMTSILRDDTDEREYPLELRAQSDTNGCFDTIFPFLSTSDTQNNLKNKNKTGVATLSESDHQTVDFERSVPKAPKAANDFRTRFHTVEERNDSRIYSRENSGTIAVSDCDSNDFLFCEQVLANLKFSLPVRKRVMVMLTLICEQSQHDLSQPDLLLDEAFSELNIPCSQPFEPRVVGKDNDDADTHTWRHIIDVRKKHKNRCDIHMEWGSRDDNGKFETTWEPLTKFLKDNTNSGSKTILIELARHLSLKDDCQSEQLVGKKIWRRLQVHLDLCRAETDHDSVPQWTKDSPHTKTKAKKKGPQHTKTKKDHNTPKQHTKTKHSSHVKKKDKFGRNKTNKWMNRNL